MRREPTGMSSPRISNETNLHRQLSGIGRKPNTAQLTIPKSPLTNPRGFIARNPANSFFCPQIFLPNPIPDVLLPRQCFSKSMCRKNMSALSLHDIRLIPRAPRFAPSTALWAMRNGPLTNPGFHCPQPSELTFFCPQIFLPNLIPDDL